MAATATTEWVIDPAHSDVHFKVRHLVISTVTGSFRAFQGTLLQAGETWEHACVSFSLAVDSLDTANAQRDEHLKSDLLFDAVRYPHISFQSTAFTQVGETTYQLRGELTIKDLTQPITLDVVYGGTADFRGIIRAGFEATGRLSRQAFGLTWSLLSETGAVVVGDEVTLSLNVELVRQ